MGGAARTAHCSSASASSSSWNSYSAPASKLVGIGALASFTARSCAAAFTAATSASAGTSSGAQQPGRPKNVAVPITVAWPTVTWNLARVRHAALKNRIARTATSAHVTECMWPGVHAMPRSSAFASSCVTHTPRRSPCVAVLTGFLNICIDFTFRLCLSSGNSTS